MIATPSMDNLPVFNPSDHLVKLKVSTSDKKIIKLLVKQYSVGEILLSGPNRKFNDDGNYTKLPGSDYKIVYSDPITTNKHFMLFNKI